MHTRSHITVGALALALAVVALAFAPSQTHALVSVPFRTSALTCVVEHVATLEARPRPNNEGNNKNLMSVSIDLDGDGFYDYLESAYHFSDPRYLNGLWVRWGTPPTGTLGTLTRISEYLVSTHRFVTADFNDDNLLDVCGVSFTAVGVTRGFHCYLQTSPRTFSSTALTIHSMTQTQDKTSTGAFDSTGDGIADLHYILSFNTLYRFPGAATGFPGSSILESEPLGMSSGKGVWTDVNRDGVEDFLAATPGTGLLEVRFHSPTTFTFAPTQALTTLTFSSLSFVSDVDGADGVDDLVLSRPMAGTSTMSLYLVESSPTFPHYHEDNAVLLAQGQAGVDFAFLDASGDGLLDLVSWSPATKLVYAALATSPGVYQESRVLTSSVVALSVKGVTACANEITGPVGAPSLGSFYCYSHESIRANIVVDTGAPVVDGNGGGTLVGDAKHDVTVRAPLYQMADMDGDGDLDVVAYSAQESRIIMNEYPSFSLAEVFASDSVNTFHYVAVGDLDLDGVNDILHVRHDPGLTRATVAVIARSGPSSFTTLSSTVLDPGYVRFMRVWDVTGDSVPDAVLSLAASSSLSASSNVVVLAGLGNGTLASSPPLALTPSYAAIVAFEYNAFDEVADSYLDLLLLSSDGYLYLHSGTPDPATFEVAPVVIETLSGSTVPAPKYFASGNIDPTHGGRDIVVAYETARAVVLISGPGSTWSYIVLPGVVGTSGLTQFSSVSIADVNKDGADDVFYASAQASGGPSGENSFLFLSNGDGTLGTQIDISVSKRYPLGVLADFDKSGGLDVLARYIDGTIGMYLHLGYTPTLTPSVVHSSYPPGRALTLAGVADVIAAGPACGIHIISLRPGTYYGCFEGRHVSVSGVDVTLRPAHPEARVVFDCASHGGGALFAVVNGGALTLERIDVRGASSPTNVDVQPLPSPIMVAGASSALYLSNVTFTGCGAPERASNAGALIGTGGAVGVASGATVEATDVRFEANVALADGGALYVSSGSTLLCTRCVFVSNVAGDSGGAVALSASSAALTACTFDGNVADFHGGALSGRASLTLEVTGSLFERNSAGRTGGALAFFRSSSFASVALNITASVMAANTALWGGAVAASYLIELPASSSASPSSLDVWALPLSSTPPMVLTLQDTSIEVTNGATHGTAFFGCGTVFEVVGSGTTTSAELFTTPNFFFHCVDATVPGSSLPLTAPHWLSLVVAPPATAADVASAVQTPVAAFRVSELPSTLVSGEVMGAGAIEGLTMYGTRVVASSAVVVLDPGAFLDISVGPARLALVDGVASLAGHGLAVLWALTPALPLDVEAMVTLDGTHGVSVAFAIQMGACPVGSGRSSEEGAPLVCVRCASSEISLEVGTQVCQPFVCELGSQPHVASLSCVCETGFYRPPEYGATAPCFPCPLGGLCASNASWPVAAPGYYPDTTELATFHECTNRAACAGAGNCAPGYDGYLCVECTGSTYREKGAVCTPCPEQATGLFTLIVLIPTLCVVALGVAAVKPASRLVRSVRKVSPGNEGEGESESEDEGADGRRGGGVLKVRSLSMGLFFIQLVGVMVTSRIRWSSATSAFLTPFTLANLDLSFFAPECTVSTFGAKFKLTLLLPLLVGVLILCASCLVAAVVRGSVGVWALTAKRMFSILAPLAYVSLAQTTISLFDCTKYPNGEYRLEAEPSMECFGSEWMALLPFGLAGFLFYVVGIPSFLALMLRGTVAKWQSPAHRFAFGFLFTHLRPACARWEVLLILKRLAFVLVVTFLNGNITLMVLTLFCLLMLCVSVHMARLPFQFYAHNVLDRVLDTALLAIVVCAALHHVLEGNQSSFSGVAVTSLTLLVVVASLAAVALVFALELKFAVAGDAVAFFSPFVRAQGAGSVLQIGVNDSRVFVVIDPSLGVGPAQLVEHLVAWGEDVVGGERSGGAGSVEMVPVTRRTVSSSSDESM